jgi:hypothetical protein
MEDKDAASQKLEKKKTTLRKGPQKEKEDPAAEQSSNKRQRIQVLSPNFNSCTALGQAPKQKQKREAKKVTKEKKAGPSST